MKSHYPNFTHKVLGDAHIVFIGDLIIKPELPVYTISIEYKGSSRPLVKVLSPALVERPPHFYPHDKTLCLYHRKNFFWKKEHLISQYIVSWTAAWIYFYEAWLQDGEWYGPEVPHDTENKDKQIPN
ncbi:MAG TPA: hypothetical protein VK750_05925 [Cytophagaceae bacterium]|nr:hypothetical protein [Cytophagaceae bacterium]